MMLDKFPLLAGRLRYIEFFSDHLKNFEIKLCFSVLESYVFGVISQYHRINENLIKTEDQYSPIQLRLDIYYYTLTWDKLKKVFEKFKEQINNILRYSTDIPIEFKNDFRDIRTRIEHLLSEYQISVRHEYEHPSLLPKKQGGIIFWGTLFFDSDSNIKTHVGKEEFAVVKKGHIDLLYSQWVELIDIFVKHFTDKPSSSVLLNLKEQIEKEIDIFVDEYTKSRLEEQDDGVNQQLHNILISDVYLTREGLPLNQETKDKLYSALMINNDAK